MPTIFLTGATGLIGTAIARLLQAQGHAVRALVRNPGSADARVIARTGVEVVQGDVADLAGVERAMAGCDGVIHSAAMLGGPQQSLAEGLATNTVGTLHVLTAAARLGVSPVVQLLTTTYFDMWRDTLTESTPLDLKAVNLDPYSLSKRLAYVEAESRVRAGQDIRFVVPGGTFGPSPCVERAMTMPSFNERMASAIKGEFDEIVGMPIPWVYVDDVAFVSVAALDKGRAGERYIAHGRQQDVGSMAFFCNRTCELAGSAHRIREVPKARLDDPEIRARYGDSWADLGKSSFPQPWSDSRLSQTRLGYRPSAMDDGIRTTIDWLRRERLI